MLTRGDVLGTMSARMPGHHIQVARVHTDEDIASATPARWHVVVWACFPTDDPRKWTVEPRGVCVPVNADGHELDRAADNLSECLSASRACPEPDLPETFVLAC